MNQEKKFDEEFKEKWMQEGGLITIATAADIWDVDPSVIMKKENLKKINIAGNKRKYISYTEFLKAQHPKKRKKKEKTEEEFKEMA